jgi:hypothetical protein
MKVELIQIFKDYKVKVMGASQFGRYKYPMTIQPRKDRRELTLRDLEDYVTNLQVRYPQRAFYLRRTYFNGKLYFVITQKTFFQGKRVRGRVPIYFDLEEQTFHIPASYPKKHPKLTNYIIMRTLGTLGVSQTRTDREKEGV